MNLVLAGLLRWLEHHLVLRKVTGSISSLGTFLGAGFDSWSGHIWEATDPCFSLTSMSVCLSIYSSIYLYRSIYHLSIYHLNVVKPYPR